MFFSPNIFRLTQFRMGASGGKGKGTVSLEEGLRGLYKFDTRKRKLRREGRFDLIVGFCDGGDVYVRCAERFFIMQVTYLR